MGFFAVPYEVHFDDTMAYGSHHFLTNFKFQCAGREHLLFSSHFFEVPEFRKDFDDVLLLTHEAYSRNLAPAHLGDRLVVLTSIEARGEVSFRFCFRTLRGDGTPVACGFQTVLTASRADGALTPFPASFRRCLDALRGMDEASPDDSFRERVLRGGAEVNRLFPEEIRQLAGRLRDESGAVGKIVGLSSVASSSSQTGHVAETAEKAGKGENAGAAPVPVPSLPSGAVAFLFAGQGTFQPALFHSLLRAQPEIETELAAVADVCRSHGLDATRLFQAPDAAAVAQLVAENPDLDQLAIFLCGALGARWLKARGVTPDVYVGHSFGEIAAMTAAGALDLRSGADVVCRRVRALRTIPDGAGTLAAVALDDKEARRSLEESGAPNLQIVGRNHSRQTVIAGPRKELERLQRLLESKGRGFSFVASRYPFHHSCMAPASDAFREALAGVSFRPLQGRQYSPIEGRFYSGKPEELPNALARHLVRPFDFQAAIESLYAAGCRRFVDCGTDGRLAKLAQRAAASKEGADSGIEVTSIAAFLEEPPAAKTAVAIVSLGCVLPGGAKDPDAFWANLCHGVSGIVDRGEHSRALVEDFVGSTGTPDRTYTLLAGAVRDEDLVAPAGLDAARFAADTREQKLLTIALSQAAKPLGAIDARRTRCLLGSTSDGSAAYDSALAIDALAAWSRDEGAPESAVRAWKAAARAAWDLGDAPTAALSPSRTLQSVVSRTLGAEVPTVLLDAACASSLYAIALGMNALERGEADLVFAGGVFAPGVSNSCFFSQFRGLSATGSRPFDESADGVVFGEGAGVVGLMRLEDARRAGLRVHAVIRGAGLSSDGRSSSANVPRSEGQVEAMKACYAAAAIDPSTVQYLEAHGTATPAGDTVELKSIGRFFGGKRAGLQLGSLKALIGHVGWAAGVASVIKLCKAIEHRQFPPQANFKRPSAALRALLPGFVVSTQEQPWPENGEAPRRAATNGFGFGGTNAHLLLEEPSPLLRGARITPGPAKPVELVVLGAEGLSARAGSGALPSSVRILPDVAEDMDISQTLGVSAAVALAEKLGDFDRLRSSTGVVFALEGKTRRGVDATARVLAQSTKRRIRELALSDPSVAPLADRLPQLAAGRVQPSGPYTLQGLMPNVTPGRIAGLLDSKGPNFVVAAGPSSWAAALRAASAVLDTGCDVVFVGGADAGVADQAGAGPADEEVTLFAVTTPAKAERLGRVALCRLSMGEAPQEEQRAETTSIAGTGRELLEGVRAANEGQPRSVLLVSDLDATARLRVSLTGVRAAPAASALAGTSGGEPGTPVRYHRPVLVERSRAPSKGPLSLRGRRVLFVVSDVASAHACSEPLGADSICLYPGLPKIDGRIRGIDLSSDAAALESLRGLDDFAPDALVAVTRVDPTDTVAHAVEQVALQRQMLELLFVCAKRDYERIRTGELAVGSLCLGAVGARRILHPVSGLFAGLFKSLGRELPSARLRAVSTSTLELTSGLERLVDELTTPPENPSIEVCYDGDQRCVRLLQPAALLPPRADAPLQAASVVLATGSRGVTAVLAEALLKKFGCSVVLVGRGGATDVPREILQAREDELPELERTFYASAHRANPEVRLPELRKRFERHLAAREVEKTLERLSRLPGQVSFRPADVTRAEEVERVMQGIAREHGRLDLIIHGAGVQFSKKLNQRRLEELRQTLDTKLSGLHHLRAAATRAFKAPVPIHALTSAFSFMGNDGQADYGAANEALDRACAFASDAEPSTPWTSIGWLGWDGIGMTRGSEYRVLGDLRRQYGIRAQEGEALFLEVLEGRRPGANHIQLTDGEREFFGIEVLPQSPTAAVAAPAVVPVAVPAVAPAQQEIVVDAQRVPCLLDHRVRGVPTLPGTWALELMFQSAIGERRPELDTITLEDARFARFVRVKDGARQVLRAVSSDRVDEPGRHAVQVKLVGDIIHPSGVVLQSGVVYAEARFTLSRREPNEGSSFAKVPSNGRGFSAPDPHCAAGSVIELRGMFDCLEGIRVEPNARSAKIRMTADSDQADHCFPALALDAALRLSAMHVDGVSNAVYAPLQLQRAIFDRGLVGKNAPALSLTALSPHIDGEIVRCGNVAAYDEAGRLRMSVEGVIARALVA